jgi:hypothetical protein|tara:strand:+ start:172 stop:477 length:306 start_codon:yes stop_codon:yes gene_type:complete
MKKYDLDELGQIQFNKALYPPKELCSLLSIPIKTFKGWVRRSEVGFPIVVRLDKSRRLMIHPKAFVTWLIANKFNQTPTASEQLAFYSKQLKAMRMARGLK